MDVLNSTLNQLNMTSSEENGTQIEGHLMTQGWRIVWDTFFGVSMFLSILGNLTIIIMMSGKTHLSCKLNRYMYYVDTILPFCDRPTRLYVDIFNPERGQKSVHLFTSYSLRSYECPLI